MGVETGACNMVRAFIWCALACLSSLLPGQVQAGDAAFHVYKQGRLAGHALINTPGGGAYVVDLGTGARAALPDAPDQAYGTRWTGDIQSRYAMRWSLNEGDIRNVTLSVFVLKTKTLDHSFAVPSVFDTPKLSPNGQYFLAFWHDSSKGVFSDEKNPLRLFRSSDGAYANLKTRFAASRAVDSSPVAWLPGGRGFVYLVANKLYAYDIESDVSTKLATYVLPSNNVLEGGEPVEGDSELSISPDGKMVAFTWRQARGLTMDRHIWVASVDGRALWRLTSVPNGAHATYNHVNPSWSPDGKWLMGRLAMDGANVAPVFSDSPEGAWYITGTTGCANSPVFVLPSDASERVIPWPSSSNPYGIAVKSTGRNKASWLTSCASVSWVQ